MKFDLGILATQPVPEIVRQVQLAESLGFETVWMTDTHLVCRELWVTLTACVLGTRRIKLVLDVYPWFGPEEAGAAEEEP